jgi:RpiB/LacA/LacB family sugar-phosphate isomerase
MKVFIGADHRGVSFKKKITEILKTQGVNVIDLGSYDSAKSCDYPKVAYKVASEVARSRNDRGILVCMSGIGQAIAANKVRGAYAALCYNTEAAILSRKHNNANILVLGSKFVKPKDIEKILQVWLNTKFEGGRHRRRVNQIKRMEKGIKI